MTRRRGGCNSRSGHWAPVRTESSDDPITTAILRAHLLAVELADATYGQEWPLDADLWAYQCRLLDRLAKWIGDLLGADDDGRRPSPAQIGEHKFGDPGSYHARTLTEDGRKRLLDFDLSSDVPPVPTSTLALEFGGEDDGIDGTMCATYALADEIGERLYTLAWPDDQALWGIAVLLDSMKDCAAYLARQDGVDLEERPSLAEWSAAISGDDDGYRAYRAASSPVAG